MASIAAHGNRLVHVSVASWFQETPMTSVWYFRREQDRQGWEFFPVNLRIHNTNTSWNLK